MSTSIERDGFAHSELGCTGDDGVLAAQEFQWRPYALIWARNDSGVSAAVPWDAAGVVLRLGDGATLRGRVLTEAGEPVPGLLVRPDDDATVPCCADENGAWRIDRLPPARNVSVRAEGSGDPEVCARKELAAGTNELDLVVPQPKGAALLVDLRLPGAPADEPRLTVRGLSEDEARFGVAEFPLPRRERSLLRIPVPWERRGIEGSVEVACPGIEAVAAAIRFPAASVFRVELAPKPGGVPARGRVVDREGRPAGGARVSSFDDHGPVWPRAECASDGTFRVATGMLGGRIRAWLPGRDASGILELGPGVRDVTLVLGESGTARGAVVDDATGAPVPGVEVWVSTSRGESLGRAISDAGGLFRIDGVPTGVPWHVRVWRVEDWDLAHDIRRLDDEERTAAMSRIAGAGEEIVREVRVRRVPGVTVDLVVRVAGPGSVSRIAVEHRAPSGRSSGPPRVDQMELTVEEGIARRELRLLPGLHEFRVTGPGLTAAPLRIEIEGPAPRREATLDVTAGAARPFLVQVAGPDGRPVSPNSRRLYARVGTGPPIDLELDARACADLGAVLASAVADGAEAITVALSATRETNTWASRLARATLPVAEAVERQTSAGEGGVAWTIPTRDVRIEIEVVDESGAPIPDALVRVSAEWGAVRILTGDESRRDEGAGEGTSHESSDGGELRTDGHGLVVFRWREPADDAWGPDPRGEPDRALLAPPWFGNVALDPSAATWRPGDHGSADVARFRVVASSVLRVALHLVDEDGGAPIGSVPVRTPFGSFVADPSGRFVVRAAPGTTRIDVEAEGFAPSGATVPASGGDDLRVPLRRARPVDVQVPLPTGMAVGTMLRESAQSYDDGRVIDHGADFATAAPGATRRLYIRPPGCTLEIESEDGWWRGSTRIEPSAAIAEVRLARIPAAEVVLRVVMPGGRPLAGRRVTLDAERGGALTVVRTNDAGEARVLVPAGSRHWASIDVESCVAAASGRFSVGGSSVILDSTSPDAVVFEADPVARLALRLRTDQKGPFDWYESRADWRDPGQAARPDRGGSAAEGAAGLVAPRLWRDLRVRVEKPDGTTADWAGYLLTGPGDAGDVTARFDFRLPVEGRFVVRFGAREWSFPMTPGEEPEREIDLR